MRPTLAASGCQRNTKKSQWISYQFAAVPLEITKRIDHPTAHRVFIVLFSCARRGTFNPSHRYLAHEVKRCRQQVIRGIEILEAAGLIRVTRRKISATRNAPNVYEIVGLVKHGVKNVTEKIKAKLSTKAPEPAAPALTANLLAKLRARDEVIGFLRRYIQRGGHIERARQWRARRSAPGNFDGLGSMYLRNNPPDRAAEADRLHAERMAAWLNGNKEKVALYDAELAGLFGRKL